MTSKNINKKKRNTSPKLTKIKVCAAPVLFSIVKFHMVNRTFAGTFKGAAVFLFYTISVITPAITFHGKTGFTGKTPTGGRFIPFALRLLSGIILSRVEL